MSLLNSPALSASSQWTMYDVSDTNQEHDLFESHIVEACDIYGFEVYYYVTDPTFDIIYGEDQNLKYLEPSLTKMMYTPGEEPSLYGQFGVLSDELIERLQLPKFTFSRDVSGRDHPVVGDLIRVPWNASVSNPKEIIYEITDVDEEGNIFQAEKFAWELTVKPMRGSEDNNIVDQSGKLDSVPISAFGENAEIEAESEIIAPHEELPTLDSLYGYD